jgi:hypothetical protein
LNEIGSLTASILSDIDPAQAGTVQRARLRLQLPKPVALFDRPVLRLRRRQKKSASATGTIPQISERMWQRD